MSIFGWIADAITYGLGGPVTHVAQEVSRGEAYRSKPVRFSGARNTDVVNILKKNGVDSWIVNKNTVFMAKRDRDKAKRILKQYNIENW